MATKSSRILPHALTIASFNANGLFDQIDEIREFLQTHQIDILLVQETFLKPSCRDPKIANYHLVRNDRVGPKGGTAIYYRRSLHCVPLDPPELTNLEATLCQVGMTGHQPIVLASVYLRSNRLVLESDLEALCSIGGATFLAGDLNSKHFSWNPHSPENRNGRILSSLLNKPSLNISLIAPDKPTRYAQCPDLNHRPSVLDLALVKNVTLQVRSVEVISELDSDHRPVLFRLGPDRPQTPSTKTITNWRKFSQLLHDSRTTHLDSIPDTIDSLESALSATTHLESHIRETYDNSTREVPAGNGRWPLDEYRRNLLTRKNTAARRHDACPDSTRKRELWKLQMEVKEAFRDSRNDRWSQKMSGLQPSHLAYYRLARSLKTETRQTMPPLVRPDLPVAFYDVEKAECLADHLEEQCSPSSEPIDADHLNKVNSEYESIVSRAPESEPLTPTDPKEVKDLIRHLKPKSAPGPDSITNRMLKLLPDHMIDLLVVILNALLAGLSFPDQWKEAIVIGIPKPGKPANLASSYRPISLLNTLGKLYERIILARLKVIMDDKSLLPNEQFGFRANHSCTHQLHRLTEYLTRHRKTGAGALFFDVAKAFDKVWHAGLIYKLHHLEVPDRMVRLIHNYLSNRSFRYRVEGELSSPRPIRAGVPQGSVLAPFLYTLYTSDIPKTEHVHLALFADDTALYTTGRAVQISSRLEKAANALADWFSKWRIQINAEKSTAVYFRDGQVIKRPPKPVSLRGVQMNWQDTVKYLGVTFDKKLNFKHHINKARHRASYVMRKLYPMICSKSKLSLRNKVILYKTCIRPIMSYASVVFAHKPASTLKRLQTLQNRFMRLCTGSPWFVRNVDLHRDLELPTIGKHFKYLSERYFEKAIRHPNPLVVGSCNYTPDPLTPSLLRRPKNVLLDPDDQITTDNDPDKIGNNTQMSQVTQRPRRRRRGPRFVTSSARFGARRRRSN